ncbi:unnamed protein product, partial [Meganyctiphanes norvegica]
MGGMPLTFAGRMKLVPEACQGILTSRIVKAENIIASCPKTDQHLLDQMKVMGCETTNNNVEAAGSSDVVLVGVKPNIVPRVLHDIKSCVTPKSPLVTSVALGVTIDSMESILPDASRVIRTMPNIPALVNCGASVYSKGTYATADDVTLTKRLLLSVGTADEVPETFMDAITGLSGAGPAYVFVVLEALADGGVKMGLPRPLAQKLAAQTIMGAAKMAIETGKHPGQLKDEVCSPGGCTIQGVAALEAGGVRASFIDAVTQATLKSLQTAGK